LVTFVALSTLACGSGSRVGAPPLRPSTPVKPAGPTVLQLPTAERALSAHDTISVLSAAQVPAALQVDGELDEWRVFADGKPTPLTPSFVAAAATNDSVVLFGRVRNLPEQGLWVWIENEVPEFPPIGTYQRGGGIMPLQCDLPEDQRMYSPFDDDTCHSMLKNYDELQKAYAATFTRQLHLTAAAISLRTGAQEGPIANAKYASKTGEGALTFEVVLPLSALPRTASPEISSMYLTAERAGSMAPGQPSPDALASVGFATPIRFGLDSEMLGCLSQNANAMMPMMPRFSYQPGTPNQVFRAANQGGFSIETTEVTLSTREGGLGSLEVRAVYGSSPFLAILKEGQLVQCTSVGDILGVVERGKGLHVIGYNEGVEESVGAQYGYYNVLEIEKDGTLHDDLLEVSEQGYRYYSVGGEHAKNLATFSISGTYLTDEGGNQQHQLLWRYDARTNRYALKQRKGRYVPPTSSEPTYSE
jgi:hypothetical protein